MSLICLHKKKLIIINNYRKKQLHLKKMILCVYTKEISFWHNDRSLCKNENVKLILNALYMYKFVKN